MHFSALLFPALLADCCQGGGRDLLRGPRFEHDARGGRVVADALRRGDVRGLSRNVRRVPNLGLTPPKPKPNLPTLLTSRLLPFPHPSLSLIFDE